MSKSKQAILSTVNYSLFHKSEGNRGLDLRKHRKLVDSMKLYGFLRGFPIVVRRGDDGKFVVKDGQHRLAIAESLGLTVHYVVEEVDFDPSVTSSAAKPWCLKDYALMHISQGRKQYQEGLDFAEQYGLPLGTAFSLLAGTTSFGNCQGDYIGGTFKIKDREWADSVATLYSGVVALCPDLKRVTFVDACMAVCRVPYFDSERMLTSARKVTHLLKSMATRDACLEMLEEVYNYKRTHLHTKPLKHDAIVALRARIPTRSKKKDASPRAA